MKNFYVSVLILIYLISLKSFSQNTCANAAPFCTSTGVNFPAGVNNGSAPSGPDYGCLGSQPNPAWYYLNISQSGPIDITLTNSAGVDIDFILWGPYPNQASLCPNIMTSSGSGPYIVDCSYSTASTEYVNIPNAVVGEWYMLLITNYSNLPTNITATQTGGTGATNCAILCNITGMTASPSACNTSNNTYSVTGVITVTAPPSTGNLTITNSCGGSPITLTPPFSTSIPYSFTGLNSNGSPCSVTAGFSADPTCTFVVNYTAPPSCSFACSISSNATQTQSVTCNGGNNGSASVTVTGGTAPFSYTWTPTGGNSSTATGLTAGVYTVTVKDANNCITTSTVQITQPSAYTLAMTTQSASCSTPGSVTVSVSGGVGGYTYTWTPSGGNSNIATGLTAGNYTVTIKDANNCYTTAVANIIGASVVNITSVNTISVSCNGGSNGSATVNVSGGATPYNYTWTPSVSTTSVATGLSAGSYSVNVMDNNNCITNMVITISQPPALSLTATQTQSVSCNGGNNGSASAVASGGVGGYTYTWTPSGGNAATASGLTAGIYTVSVNDVNNCNITQTVQITQPPALSLTATQTQSVSCNGGNNGGASAVASGGVGGYTYTWMPSGGNAATANNLTQGVYTITVSDANLCGPISTTVQIQEPPALSITVSGQSVTCYGYSDGSATVSVTGGVGGYSYTWTPSGGNASVANNLTANIYTVQVLDANACYISASINIPQPSSVSIVTTPNQTICFGNSANILANASGGNSPYTYNWSNALPNNGGPHLVSPTITTIYTVQAVDADNCVSPVGITKVTVLPPLQAVGMQTTVCDGLSVSIYPTITSPGNGGPYNYLWSNGQTAATISVNGNYTLGSVNIYTVIVSDGCTVPDAVTEITVNVHPNPVFSFSAMPQKGCVPLTVQFSVTADTLSNMFLWNFDNGSSGNTAQSVTTYTASGMYSPTLTVSNIYGCTATTVALNYIEAYPIPDADFEADPWGTSIITPTINFINTSQGAVSYLWNFGDYSSPTNTSTAVNPSHEYMYSGSYTVSLVATNQYGCSDYVAKSIYIEPEFHLYIPNAFTPDGNGLNDVFQPKGIGIDENDYKMLIFDRWGELIFQTQDFKKGWDGTVKGNAKKSTQDVYVYKIYVKDIKGNKHEFVGHVTCLPTTEE